ncbi:hypothetical protein [Cryptosporangium sp. NPDC051539]|uniref:hypothetical protein n=1 Tax=Cryptosporangium sp. NPDC051539 TaxID=3363962 RepID=UPI0037BA02BE
MTAAPEAATIRPAVEDDLDRLRELHTLARALPPTDAGIPSVESVDGVTVAAVDGRAVAFLVAEHSPGTHIVLTTIVVDPEHDGHGHEAALVGDVLRAADGTDVAERSAISMQVAFDASDLLQALFDQGFVGRRALEDLFGRGRHGLYCVYKSRYEYLHPDERYLLALTSWQAIHSLISQEHYAVTGAYVTGGRRVLEVSRFESEDAAALQSDESMAGITFAAGILAAITFVLGFSFTSNKFPDDIKVLLLGAALTATLALIIYANTSGELARIRSNAFVRNMRWGNVLSEYGGVLPFVVALEVTYARITQSWLAALITGVLTSLALLLYFRSDFCLARRFESSFWSHFLTGLIVIAPAAGSVVVRNSPISWPWTVAFSGTLIAAATIFLASRKPEGAGGRTGVRRWQIRR